MMKKLVVLIAFVFVVIYLSGCQQSDQNAPERSVLNEAFNMHGDDFMNVPMHFLSNSCSPPEKRSAPKGRTHFLSEGIIQVGDHQLEHGVKSHYSPFYACYDERVLLPSSFLSSEISSVTSTTPR
jgi:hypothetical protein